MRIPYRYREHIVSLGIVLAFLAGVAFVSLSVMHYANKIDECKASGGEYVRGAFGYVCVGDGK